MKTTEQEVMEVDEKPIHYTKFTAIVVPDKICSKIRYNSYRDAQVIINCVKHPRKNSKGRKPGRRVGKKDIKPVRSYLCPECGFWHLTSMVEYDENN